MHSLPTVGLPTTLGVCTSAITRNDTIIECIEHKFSFDIVLWPPYELWFCGALGRIAHVAVLCDLIY